MRRFPDQLSEAELEVCIGELSESDETISELEDHWSELTESENSDNEIDSNVEIHSETIFSKDGKIEWMPEPYPRHGQRTAANIIRNTPGVTRYATSRINDIKSSFQAAFPDSVQNIIINMTNKEGNRVFREQWKYINNTIFEAYLGLLLLAGVYRSHGESTKSLWHKELGRNIFRATMSLETFCAISRVLRFDDRTNREERRRTDKLAPIRDIWEKWVDIQPKLYNPDAEVTVDEQLVAFRGRCPFKQYIPSKPAKYGIKIWALCDSKSSYAIKLQIYTGKEHGAAPEKNQGMRVVNDLCSGLSGHNITCDNFFTSYNLGQLLLKKNLTMLGTIRKNKPELPKPMNNTEVYTSSFYFTSDTTVVNYIPKKNKSVVLMSTHHLAKQISNRDDKKPQIILDYNSTKGAVDTLDQLVTTYTCKRKTNRWPMIVFYNMIDISAYNAFVLWTSINPQWNGKKLTKRRLYLEQLGQALIEEHIKGRLYMPRTEDARNVVERFQRAQSSSQATPAPRGDLKRSRCKFCPSTNDNKTNIVCSTCTKHICKAHCTTLCPNCKP